MRKKREGSAMIVVVCVMIVAVALSMALLLTASILINNAIRTSNKEQCRINSISVSDLLMKEIDLIRYDGSEETGSLHNLVTAEDFNAYVPPRSDAEGRNHTLAGKLKTVVTNEWYAYNPDAGILEQLETSEKDYFTYDLGDCGLPGETTVELYWIDESDYNLKNLDMSQPFDAAEKFQSVLLYLKVTSTVGEESSTIISTYQPVVNTKRMDDTGDVLQDEAWEYWEWKYRGHEWERGDS